MNFEFDRNIKDESLLYVYDLKNALFKQKKYCLMYLILILICSLSLFSKGNYSDPMFEIMIMVIVSILGLWGIGQYFLSGDKELYKTVFVLILIFGLVCCFITPIDSVSDESEHLIRAEITSQGVLFPHYENGGFITITAISDLVKSKDTTVFGTDIDTDKIDHTPLKIDSAFEENPFFGYIFSGLGVFVAKLLDLNVIWMLWLGRIFNMFFYAFVAAYAIKKTPIFKIPMMAIICLPICLFQVCSISSDCIMAGLGILAIAYFFNMYANSFGKREIIIFSVICLLAGLCKLPMLGLIILMFFLPSDNFDEGDKMEYYLYCVVGFLAVAFIGIIWSNSYATPALAHSWRNNYLVSSNVNVNNQINYIISHPTEFLISFFNFIPNSIHETFNSLFTFYASSRGGPYNGSKFISMLLTLFFGFICLGYPIERKLKLKAKIGALITFIVIYAGTYFVFLLSWTPVGNLGYYGVHSRYFLPIFALLPFACNINFTSIKDKDVDYYTLVMVLFFISAMIISLTVSNY